MSRPSKKNSRANAIFSVLPIVLALVLASLSLLMNPTEAGARESDIRGSALRPTPLLMPMDYVAARAQAWLSALKKSAPLLPPAAPRRLKDLGLDAAKTGGDAALLALAARLFPLDVITPQISSSQEIQVYLKKPAKFDNFSKIVGDVESLALTAIVLLEMEDEIDALGEAWPNSLDEAREKTGELEAHASALDALWEMWQLIPIADDEPGVLENLARMAPKSPAIRLLLAESLLRLNKPQQSIDEINAAMDQARNFSGEKSAIWNFLRPRARYTRALAQWRLNQLALAEDDLNAAIQEAARLPAAHRTRLHDVRGALRMRRGNSEGMCADFSAACSLGNCHSLARASRAGLCKP